MLFAQWLLGRQRLAQQAREQGEGVEQGSHGLKVRRARGGATSLRSLARPLLQRRLKTKDRATGVARS